MSANQSGHHCTTNIDTHDKTDINQYALIKIGCCIYIQKCFRIRALMNIHGTIVDPVPFPISLFFTSKFSSVTHLFSFYV